MDGFSLAFCLQAVAGRRPERERPHRRPALPGGDKERPECKSLLCLKSTFLAVCQIGCLGECQQQLLFMNVTLRNVAACSMSFIFSSAGLKMNEVTF